MLDYRKDTPPGTFDLTVPPGAVFGIPEGADQAVGDDYWVALTALSVGQHQLHFTATMVGTGPYDGIVATQEITHNLTDIVTEPSGPVLAGLGALMIGAYRKARGGRESAGA